MCVCVCACVCACVLVCVSVHGAAVKKCLHRQVHPKSLSNQMTKNNVEKNA